mgnify:CR=1 FL=1
MMNPQNVLLYCPENGQRVIIWHPSLRRWFFGTYWVATKDKPAHFAGPPSGYIDGALYWLPEPENPEDA